MCESDYSITSSKRRLVNDDDSDEYNTDEEASTPAATSKRKSGASTSRKPKTSIVQRQDRLENDAHTKNVTAHELYCNACGKRVGLNPKRPYDPTHWDQHRAKCPRITGKQTVRTAKNVVKVEKVSNRLVTAVLINSNNSQ